MPRTRLGASLGEEKSEENKQEEEVKSEVDFSFDASIQKREVPVKWWPKIKQGTCEFCGVMDSKVPAWEQYKHCNHYKKLDVRCLYCPAGTDPDEWFKGRTLNIVERLDRPKVLSVFCDNLSCTNKFYGNFKA